MRVAALYDIHGNLPALDAVIEEVDRASVDRIVVGGDVLPGPMPAEALARLQDLNVPVDFIHGNGESAVLASLAGREPQVPAQARLVVHWSAKQLTSQQARAIAEWPSTCRLEIPGVGPVLFCHATPRSDTEIFLRTTPEDRLRPIFEGLDVPLIVCGHTHMQFDRRIGAVRVINAGSVGMPFGPAGADWLLLGPDVRLRHTMYDLAPAAERIRATSYPQADEFATRYVLQPPSEASMLEALARAELTA